MSHEKCTAFSADSLSAAVKQLFALGVASIPGLTYESLATALDVSIASVRAWIDPKRTLTPPAWVPVRLRQTHPALAAYLDAGLDALSRSPRGPVVHTLEAQTNVLCASLATVLATDAESKRGDGQYDSDEAARLAAVLASHIATCQRSLELAEKRAGLDRQTRLEAVR